MRPWLLSEGQLGLSAATFEALPPYTSRIQDSCMLCLKGTHRIRGSVRDLPTFARSKVAWSPLETYRRVAEELKSKSKSKGQQGRQP